MKNSASLRPNVTSGCLKILSKHCSQRVKGDCQERCRNFADGFVRMSQLIWWQMIMMSQHFLWRMRRMAVCISRSGIFHNSKRPPAVGLQPIVARFRVNFQICFLFKFYMTFFGFNYLNFKIVKLVHQFYYSKGWFQVVFCQSIWV